MTNVRTLLKKGKDRDQRKSKFVLVMTMQNKGEAPQCHLKVSMLLPKDYASSATEILPYFFRGIRSILIVCQTDVLSLYC